MSKRLVKVAAELNVGTKTIVEFLNGNGYEVVNRPTAKISDEMYNELVQNFQKSIAIKEKAEGITIGSRVEKEKKEEKKIVKEKKVVENTEKSEEVPLELKEELVKQDEVVVDEKEEPVLKGPKILGKIDLEGIKKGKGRRTKTSSNKEEPKEEKIEAKEELVVKEEAKKEPQKVEEPKEEKIEAKEEVKKEPQKVEEPKEEKIEAKEELVIKTEEDNEVLEEAEATTDDDNIKTKAPQLKGLKILGKINIEPKKKKKRKGKKEEKAKTEETEKGEEAGRKKRRKRTKISKGETVKEDAKGDEKKGDEKKGEEAKGDDNKRKKKKRKDKRKEISEKEVDDKLKETMQRLHGSSKKNKKFGSTRSARDEKKEQMRLKMEEELEEDLTLQVTEFVSVSELAGLLDVSPADVITTCMDLGQFVSINQRLDADIIELIATEFGREVEFISAEDQIDIEEEEEEDDPKDLSPRSPIVTVMGHVDHGKTSLLDYIRKANVASGEAGGITQHIGAYEVTVAKGDGAKGTITFLDTPGHEAFTAMRARGAKVTDIAVIIISADDNIMPQTREAISHAQAAGVPIIFAINKIDKEGANPDKIKQELASMNLLIEEWGGTYQSQDISAKKGTNIDLLLEKILLEAEMLELKANPKRRAVGAILEASLEKGRGYVAKVLVQTGTMKIGDPIVAGQYGGRVKAMFNERGKRVKKAGPSTPVLILGLDGAPQAGEKIQVLESERDVKDLANKRAQIIRQQQIRATRRITLDDITRRLKVGNFQELNLIVKGDMDGSVEALADSLLKLSTEQIQTNIIYKAVGQITESDVNLAAASDAIIIGFQVRPNPSARRLSEQEGVEIKTYSIIYDAIEEVKSALEGMLEPKQVEENIGLVEIQQVFSISKVGTVAGCMVKDGKITRNSFIRIIRDGIVIYPKKEGVHGELSSLKRFKDSVAEVKKGFECGLTVRNFDKIQAGDEVEVYEMKEVKQKL
jgi:translation initiation factor IF-2